MLKVFFAVEMVLAAAVGVVFLAGTVADNWVPVLAVFGAVITSAISPVVMSNLNNRAAERRAAQAAGIAQAAQERDWARQDEVRNRVLEAARLAATAAKTLTASNKEVAKKVSEVADSAAMVATSTVTRLDELASGQQQIHALVNSNLVASMKSQLAALRASHVALTTLADLQEAGDKPVFQETRQQAEDVGKAVALLEGEINDRLAATEQAGKGE